MQKAGKGRLSITLRFLRKRKGMAEQGPCWETPGAALA